MACRRREEMTAESFTEIFVQLEILFVISYTAI